MAREGLPVGVLALRSEALSLRDPDGVLRQAIDQLERYGVVAVVGAKGTGHGRLVREIAAATDCRVETTERSDPLDAAGPRRHALRLPASPSVIGVGVRGTEQVAVVAQRWRAVGIPAVTTRPLPRATLGAIACELLGTRRVPATVEPIIDLAGGRPGDLIDLLLGSRETGALELTPAGWMLRGPANLDRATSGVLTHRSEIGVGQRDALDVVAVAGAVPIRASADLVDPAEIARLHSAGWLALRRFAGTAHVTMDRPVDGAVVATALDPDSLEQVRGRILRAVSADTAARPAADFGRLVDAWTATIDRLFAFGGWRPATSVRAQSAPDSRESEHLVAVLREAAAPVRRLDTAQLSDSGGTSRSDGSSWTAEVADAAAAMLAIQTGPLETSEVEAEARRQQAEHDGDTVGDLVWSDVEAAIAECSGQRWVARDALAGVEALAERLEVPSLLGEIVARRAVVAAETGRLTRAEDELARSRALGRGDERTMTRLGVVEALILSGKHVDRAAGRAIRAAEQAVEACNLDLALQAAVLPARLGVMYAAAESLLRYAVGERRVPVGAVHVRHIEAIADGDADDLTAVGVSYVRLGRRLLAAETFAAAARRAAPRAQAGLRRRAAGLLTSCPGAWTVGVADLEPRRIQIGGDDRRIATAAVSGSTNVEIAGQLALSPRTVEARLTRIFRQLGVTSRRELAEMHAPLFQAGRRRARAR